MDRVRDRDRDAFAVLVERHLDGVHAFCYRLARDADDAADLAQETFLRVWSRARTWRPGRARFTTWLYRIARNLGVDAHRRRRDAAAEDVDALPDDAAPPEQASADARLRAALAAALSALPERQRTALALCHRQGMSQRDAAAVLGVSVDALESLLARARRALRARLRRFR